MGFWHRGQRSEIADRAGISRAQFSEILHRKRRVSYRRAKLLEDVSGQVLGYPIPCVEWLENETTAHPAFMGEGDNDS